MSPADTFLNFGELTAADHDTITAEHRGEHVLLEAELSSTGGYATLIASFPGHLNLDADSRCYLLLQLASIATRQAADAMTGAGKAVAMIGAADIDRAAHSVDPSVKR